MKNCFSFFLLSAFVLLSAPACRHRIGDFTALSTKSIDWSRADTFKRERERSSGKDTAHMIFFVPTGSPQMKEAVDHAIESVPGAVALVDVVIYRTDWYIPFLYGQMFFTVEGNALIDPDL